MRKIINTLKEKWPEYLIESIVIIASILGAYSLDSWNDKRKSYMMETELLENILKDIRADSAICRTYLEHSIRLENMHQQVYRESRDPTLISDSLDLKIIRAALPYTSVFMDNHEDNVNSISIQALRDQIVNYIRRDISLLSAAEQYSEYILGTFRPYLSMHDVHDLDALFSDDRSFAERTTSYINYEKLQARYQTKAFDRQLFELKIRHQYFKECLEIVSKENELLKMSIIQELRIRQ